MILTERISEALLTGFIFGSIVSLLILLFLVAVYLSITGNDDD